MLLHAVVAFRSIFESFSAATVDITACLRQLVPRAEYC